MRHRSLMSPHDANRLTSLLRARLGAPRLQVFVPSGGQTPQLHDRNGEIVGTADLDDDGDYVITISILRDELSS